jgi:predicted RNA-binding protein
MVTTETTDEQWTFVSIPVVRHLIRMADLRDLVEATEEAPESAVLYVLPGELRYEMPR